MEKERIRTDYDIFCNDIYPWIDNDKEEDDLGRPQLKDDAPPEIKKAYEEIKENERKNLENGLIID